MTENRVGAFFDSLTSDYTAVIERCFPRYREMLAAVLDYLPGGREFHSILELGCGTGNFSVLLQAAFPEAEITFVDVSADSLNACRDRIGNDARWKFHPQDFRSLNFAEGQFDLVTSSIAIHHLQSLEKQSLFADVLRWLSPGGVFSFADQCRGATDDLYARHMHNWKANSLAAGASEAEFEMWMEHQREHDYHDTLKDQMDWLTASGFTSVDCVWRCWLWSVLQARKP